MAFKISVILPNYNSEKYLERCIQSFLDQDYEFKELIIVDGKSTDASHSIIENFSSKNSSITWVKEKDSCVTDGFNIGLKYASGDFIGFMASDAVYFTNDVLTEISNANKVIALDAIYFDSYTLYVNDSNLEFRNSNYRFHQDDFLINDCFLSFENIFFSSKIYKDFKLDPVHNVYSDYEFYLRMLSQKKLIAMHVNKISTINTHDGLNISMKFAREQYLGCRTSEIKMLFEASDLQPEQLAIHHGLIDNAYLISKASIEAAEKWLLQLFEANNSKKFYSQNIFKEKFIPYWGNLLHNSAKLGLWSYFKFMNSPLTKDLNLSKKAIIKFLIKCILSR